MQRHHHLYHFIFIVISIILCIVLPFSSFAADEDYKGGALAQIMGLEWFNYVSYSYASDSNPGPLWQSVIGSYYKEISVSGNRVYTNSSTINLTRWSSLDYYATVEFKLPLLLGEYTYNDFDPVSGNLKFWFHFHNSSETWDLTEFFTFDSAFFKGKKFNGTTTEDFNYLVDGTLSDSYMLEDPSDAGSDHYKFINLDWLFTRGEDANDDIKNLRDRIDLDYLYIRVKINMESFNSAQRYVGTRYGISSFSALNDQQYQDSIIINLESLQTALEAMSLMQQEKFDEVIDLLQSIADNNKQQQVIQILQDLIQTSPDDPDLPEIEQSDQKTDQIIDRQEQISEALGSVPKEDIDNIGNIINPSTVIVNSDPATVQTALKVIYEWDTFLYIVTIVAALMVISYVIFGKKR